MKILYIAMGLMMLNGLSAQAQDTSCGIVWDAPILLSDTTYNAGSPRIALSGDDTVHITWWSLSHVGTGELRLPYCRSFDGGATMQGPVELLTDSLAFPGYANSPKIVAWRSNVYAFFQGSSASDTPIRMVKSTTGGSSWDYPVDISPDSAGPPPLTPTIMGDTIAMTYVPLGQVTHNILRSTNSGASWVSVNAGLPNFSIFALGSRAASNSGALHLVQIGVVGNQGEIEYRRSHDLGDTWVQQTFLSTIDGLQSIDPIIGTSTDDTTVVAAWRDPKYGCIGLVGCSVLGRVGVVGSDSTSWNPEQVLTDIPAGYEPKVSVHRHRAAAGWPMDQTFSPFAEVRVSDDTSWCSVFDPTTGIATRVVIIVDVAISSKAVHVVWEASQAPDPSTFRIFYRRGRFIDTDVKEERPPLPSYSRLEQNYPNPFNPNTTIRFKIQVSGFTTLKVYDMLGRKVATLVNEKKDVGEHVIEWNAEGVPSGVYYYRLIAGDRVETKKAILIR